MALRENCFMISTNIDLSNGYKVIFPCLRVTYR